MNERNAMRRMSWKLGLLAAALMLGPGLLGTSARADPSNDEGDPQTTCIQGCQDDTDLCSKICKEHAGAKAGRCVSACKTEQKACEKDCKEPANEE